MPWQSARRGGLPAPADAVSLPAAASCRAWPPLAHGLVLVLSLVSAVALLALGLSLRPASALVNGPAMSAADLAVVEQLYAGLNDVLAGGDPAQLDAVLAQDAVVELPGQPAGDRATLLAWLVALRRAAPGIRLTLADVLVGGNRAAARATADGGQPWLAGAPLLGVPAAWDASAFLQLRDGRVAAFALIAAPPPMAEALPPFRQSIGPGTDGLTVARLHLPTRRSQAPLHLLQGQLLLAEAGAAQVDGAGSVQRVVVGPDGGQWHAVLRSAQPIVLQPGDALRIPPDVPLTIHSADAGSATLLLLGALPLAPEAARRPLASQHSASRFASGAGLLQLADGASLEPVADGQTPIDGGSGGEAIVTVTRATLPPGAALAPHPVAGGELIAVEAGLLGVAAPTSDDANADPAGDVVIRDGYWLTRGTMPRLRNAGGTPLALVIVTIDPLAPAGAAVAASPGAPTGGWLPNWTASRVATATAAGQVCSASACH